MKNFICKNDEKLLDLLKVSVEKKDETARQKVAAALQAFINKPEKVRKKLQAVSTTGDFEVLVTGAFNITVAEDNFDMGWEMAYQDVPRDADKDFWEIGDITNGITFRKVPEGNRIQVDKLSGTQDIVYVDYYGGALGFTDRAIRFRKLAQIYSAAKAFRNKFWANKADNHYALLAAGIGAGNTIAWQGVAADARVQRDVLTINQGQFSIGDACKDKGYGDMATAPMILYANPADQERIEAAFRVTTNYLAAGAQNGTAITSRVIKRIYTYNSNIVAGSPLLVLPGHKLQKNEAMAPTTYVAADDVLTLNRVQSVWSIYGAVVGDTDQLAQLTLS